MLIAQQKVPVVGQSILFSDFQIGKILHVGVQRNQVFVWFEIDNEEKDETHCEIFITSEIVPTPSTYINSFEYKNNWYHAYAV